MSRNAWLTPDDSTVWCEYRIIIPEPLSPMLEGALVLLCVDENWETFGDLTPEDCAQIFRDAFAELEYGCGVFLVDDDGLFLSDDEGRIIIEG